MAKRIASACVCLLVALVFAAPAGAATEPDHTLVEAGKAMTMVVDYVAALEAEQARVDAALASLGEQIAAYVYAAEHPPPPPPRAADPAPVRAAGGGGGTPSAAHWAAIAQCESGNTNGWRTGYFGIMSGNEGNYSYDEQVAHANAIYAQYGPGAWGCKTDIP